MIYRHYFEPNALKEYLAALNWYKKRSDKAAANFVIEMDTAISTICSDLFRFRIDYKLFRQISLKNIRSTSFTQLKRKRNKDLFFQFFTTKETRL